MATAAWARSASSSSSASWRSSARRSSSSNGSPGPASWPASIVGALACAILVANNLRDIATDVVAGKRTVAVRLGDARTRWLYLGLGLVAWAGVAVCGLATPWALLGLLGLLPWLPAAAKVRSGADGPGLIPVLAQTGIAELVTAVGLAVGFTLGG